MRALTGDQRGATLMEVLIAMAIIAVGVWALSAAIPLAAYGIQEGNQLSTATFLVNQRLEHVRNARWEESPCVDALGLSASATVAPVGSCAGGAVTFADENPVLNQNGAYTRTVRITRCGVGAGCSAVVDPVCVANPNAPDACDLRQVVVTVTYRPMTGTGVSAAGTAKASTVTMYVARR